MCARHLHASECAGQWHFDSNASVTRRCEWSYRGCRAHARRWRNRSASNDKRDGHLKYFARPHFGCHCCFKSGACCRVQTSRVARSCDHASNLGRKRPTRLHLCSHTNRLIQQSSPIAAASLLHLLIVREVKCARGRHHVYLQRSLAQLRLRCAGSIYSSSYEERHSNSQRKPTPTRHPRKAHSASHTLVHAPRHSHITACSERAACLTHHALRRLVVHPCNPTYDCTTDALELAHF